MLINRKVYINDDKIRELVVRDRTMVEHPAQPTSNATYRASRVAAYLSGAIP